MLHQSRNQSATVGRDRENEKMAHLLANAWVKHSCWLKNRAVVNELDGSLSIVKVLPAPTSDLPKVGKMQRFDQAENALQRSHDFVRLGFSVESSM